ncbi:host attachment protein [Ancylobacter oerskovii]|uniref:Host attachment protein n=1 Tax=Ancylobacter oerskovii TaxID=459519 RepID=A0ABW4YTV8_9HYPH|nr:host attachment family protein [Ancylobacter oerskovii]MBS7543718.1 host attachment protein [Ancylobacter oerskovii]
MTHPDKIRLPAGVLVAVCDGRRALILRNEGDAAAPNLRTREVHEQDNPPTAAQGTDAPGRVHQSVGTARSAVETTDFHEEAEAAFLRQVAGRLETLLAAGEADSLVMVAAPRALGILRPLYGRAVQQALIGEVRRDMVHLPVEEIERHLAA